MDGWAERAKKALGGAGRSVRPRRWDGLHHLAPVRARIVELGPGCAPDVVRDVHLQLLGAFGESIGSDFRPWQSVDAPSKDLIAVTGRFDKNPGEPDFRLWLQPEEGDDGRTVRVAWLIDLYLPERWRRRGAGTALMDCLVELWGRVGIDVAKATATAEGHRAYLSWGFSEAGVQGVEDALTDMRLELRRPGPERGQGLVPSP